MKINVLNEENRACNHKPESAESTLEYVPVHFMTVPRKYYTICLCCGQSFVFVKNNKGKYLPYDEEQENLNEEVKATC